MTQYVDSNERDLIFQRLLENPDNNKCIDCDSKKPKWASASIGVFLCFDCAAKHREYGVAISFVRSLTLDGWTQKQVLHMEHGGNTKAIAFFTKQGLISKANPKIDYKSPVLSKYKAELDKKVDAVLKELNKSNNPEIKGVNEVQVSEQKTKIPETNGQAKQEAEPEKKKEEIKQSPTANNSFQKANSENNINKMANFQFSFKNEPSNFSNKAKLKGKKIDDFDFNALSIDDSAFQKKNEKSASPFNQGGMLDMDTNKNLTSKPGAKDYHSLNSSNNALDKLKTENVKAISSKNFFGEEEANPETKERLDKFSNSKAISSAAFFGKEEEQESEDKPDLQSRMIDMLFSAGDQLRKAKEQASNYITNLKTNWEQQN